MSRKPTRLFIDQRGNRRRCYDVSNGRNRNMRSELGEFLLEWAVVVALFVAYVLFVTYALFATYA